MKGNSHKVQMSVLSKLVSVFTILLFFSSITHAQVTIGLGEEPISGALLQLKEKEKKDLQNNDDPNSDKGLAFPRVALVQKDRLYPMFGKTEATETSDYKNNRSDINKEHTGLVVYNTYISPTGTTDANLIFQEGLYEWMGDKWVSVGTPVVNNGLSLTDKNEVQLGGKLIKNTAIDLNENTLSLIGLKDNTTDSRPVVIDETGKLSRSGVSPIILTFMQSSRRVGIPVSESRNTNYTLASPDNNYVDSTFPGFNGFVNQGDSRVGTTLNWGKAFTVPFLKDEIIINNDLTLPVYDGYDSDNLETEAIEGAYSSASAELDLVNICEKDNDGDYGTPLDPAINIPDPDPKEAKEYARIKAFQLTEDCKLELSGYVNFQPNIVSIGGDDVAHTVLNATIQVSRVIRASNGDITRWDDWVDYTSARIVITDEQVYYISSVNIPPAIFDGKKGDRIRMIIQRPYNTVSGKTTFLGYAYGRSNTNPYDGDVNIEAPWGTEFSHGIKITAVGDGGIK